MQPSDTTEISVSVSVPEAVASEIQEELSEMNREGDEDAFRDLALERLNIELTGLPQSVEYDD